MRNSVYRDCLTIKEICKERRVYLSIDGKLTQIDPSSIEVDEDEEIIIKNETKVNHNRTKGKVRRGVVSPNLLRPHFV